MANNTINWLARAITSLTPNAHFGLANTSYDGIQWHDTIITQPSEDAVNAEIIRLQTDYNSKEYQRNRQPEYPSLADFADAYYWAQKGDNTKMEQYVAKCDEVRAKYPKANTA